MKMIFTDLFPVRSTLRDRINFSRNSSYNKFKDESLPFTTSGEKLLYDFFSPIYRSLNEKCAAGVK